MFHIVMIVKGKIRVPKGDERTYGDAILRASALTNEGLTACEVVLENPSQRFGNIPVFAELRFPRVVSFSDNTSRIELYRGSELVSIFEPLTLKDSRIKVTNHAVESG